MGDARPGGDAPEALITSPPQCPICHGEGWSLRHEHMRDRLFDLPGEFRVWQCDICETLRLWPVPDDLGSYYPDDYGPHSVQRERYVRRPWHSAWRSSFSGLAPVRRAARRLLRHNNAATNMWNYLDVPPRSIFDYGCGSAHFLGGASQLGIEVLGMDLSQAAVDKAVSRGIPCLHGSYEDLSGVTQRFEMVRGWHVLEHVSDPVRALAALRPLLEPAGRLVIEVPNARSAMAGLFGRDWYPLDVPRHLWGFNEQSLRLAFVAAGYTVERVVHDGKGNEIYHSIRYALETRDSSASLPSEAPPGVPGGLTRLARFFNEQGQGDAIIVVAFAARGD
jgi:2-polyprenyl-3-methyl-5-hydroxy-6-metoxy-1,4-benzoquinol methylase